MSIRAKTKKRLVLLLVLMAIGLVGLTSAYFARRWYLQKAALASREMGMEAVKRGDPAAALEQLTIYIRRFPKDTEALYQRAVARSQVELPNGKHLGAAVLFLQQLMEIKPDYTEAHHTLLELYPKVGLSTEALASADRLLARFPDDAIALRTRAIALMRLHKLPEAAQAMDRYLGVAPHDLAGQLMALDIMQEQHKPADEIVARATALRKKFPDDAGAEVVQAVAYRLANDLDHSMEWSTKAMAHPLPDAEFTLVLVGLLDSSGRYSESNSLLEKSLGTGNNPQLQRLLAQRLWENGQDVKLIDWLAKFDPAAATTPVDLVAYKAFALMRQGREGDAKALLAVLGKRPEPRAEAWTLFLRDCVLPKTVAPAAILEICRTAVAKDASIGPVRFIMGEAYAGMGEPEQAVREWGAATRMNNSWAMPFIRLAALFNSQGRYQEAIQLAVEGFRRAPSSIDALTTLISARAANLPNNPQDSAAKILVDNKPNFEAAPDAPRLIQLRVQLLFLSGKAKEAAQLIEQVAASPKKPDADLLLRLAEFSRAAKLGLEDQVLARYEKEFGSSPDLVAARADQLATQGKVAEGRKLIADAKQQAPQAQALAWKAIWARYLDNTADPEAKTAMTDLSESAISDAATQQSVLHARSVAGDRKLQDQVIERMKAIGGESGTAWRIARANWLLQSSDVERDTPAAINMLRDLVKTAPEQESVRLMLANAMLRQGNRAGAIEELKAAQLLAPSSTPIAVDLAELLQEQGQSDAASAKIDEVLKSPAATAASVRRVAMLLAKRGELERSSAILEKLDQSQGSAAAPDMQLATIYRARHDLDAAQAIAKRALAAKADAGIIEFIVNIELARGHIDEATKALSLLDNPAITPDVRELVLARFAQNRGRRDEALDHYRKATQAAPSNVTAWRSYLTFLIATGNAADIGASIKAAAAALPNEGSVTDLALQSDQIAQLKPDVPSIMRPIMASVLEDPSRRAAAIEGMKVMASAIATHETSDVTLSKLIRISEQGDSPLALENAIASIEISMRRWDDAAKQATRAAEAYPNNAEPVELAVQALSGAGRWAEALEKARRWHSLTLDNPYVAELAMANAELHLNHLAEAAKILEPGLELAQKNPDARADLLNLFVQIQVARRQYAQAAKLIEPLLARSATPRAIWMNAAVTLAPDVKVGSGWLDSVGRAIPGDKIDEQTALANQWIKLGFRFNDKAAIDTGRGQLQALGARPEATAFTMLSLAEQLDRDNDLVAAEKLYRLVLEKLDKTNLVARNNLAMVLVRRSTGDKDKVLEEAESVAASVVKDQPGNPAFIDTLAAVQARRGEMDQAIASEREAVRLAPDSIQFRVTLIGMLVTARKSADAAAVIAQIDDLVSKGAVVPDDLKAQLEAARKAAPPKGG